MEKTFLGIDTSNYTTSAALCGKVNFNGKKLLPVEEGKIGLRQSEAVFHHVKQLPSIVEEAFKVLGNEKISAIGVSDRPRSNKESYMPCFLAGEGAASMLSSALNVPLYKFSHQQGHVAAALYSCGRMDLLKREFLAFHISGGTTEALMVAPDSDKLPVCTAVAASLDLKAGQAIDRVGVLLGMPFPAGKYVDELASKSTAEFKIRPSMINSNFSLSGVQNRCEAMIEAGTPKEDVAKFVIMSIIKSIDGCLEELLNDYGKDTPIVFSGGVSSNSLMRKYMTEKYGALFTEPQYSSDNAYGTAVLAAVKSGELL
ncbi:MAG: peptidase M22 [Ruminococcaceae bacterium]|nr:peptidase M22 [Oscillospiraceae bacterium]